MDGETEEERVPECSCKVDQVHITERSGFETMDVASDELSIKEREIPVSVTRLREPSRF